jgi:hypothetical protein
MARKLDVEKVDSALKRAARVAVSGAKVDRAGRFLARDASSGRFADKTTRGAKDAPPSKSK